MSSHKSPYREVGLSSHSVMTDRKVKVKRIDWKFDKIRKTSPRSHYWQAPYSLNAHKVWFSKMQSCKWCGEYRFTSEGKACSGRKKVKSSTVR